jgi:hypothetical protein
MNENKAWALAYALDASMLLIPDGGGYAVGVIRSDDRFAMFQDHGGLLYADEDTCLSSDVSDGLPSLWATWGLGESWAMALATLIRGQAHHRRGDAWEVLFQRGDGRFAVIGSDDVELYQSRGHYAACEKPEYCGWHWDV